MTEQQPSPTWNAFLTSATGISTVTFDRISDEIFVIIDNWGDDWRSDLEAGGVRIQAQPSYQLAFALARLADFESDIPSLLSSLRDFRADQEDKAAVEGKQINLETSSLFGTAEQRTAFVPATALKSWLDFLKKPALHPNITARSRRQEERNKRKVQASTPITSPQHTRPRRTPSSPEVARGQIAAQQDCTSLEPQEEPTAADSLLEDSGVNLPDLEEELSLPLPSPHPSPQQPPPMMADAVADLLRDPIWASALHALSQIRKRSTDLKNVSAEKQNSLVQAEEQLDNVRKGIKDALGFRTDATTAILQNGIEKFKKDLAAEEDLLAFKARYGAEFARLAAAAPSASSQIAALDETSTRTAIAGLSAELCRWEEGLRALFAAESTATEAEKEKEEAEERVEEDERRKAVFEEIAGAGLGNGIVWGVVGEEMERRVEQQ